MPRQVDGKARREQPEEPPGLDLRAGQALDAPAAAETAHVLEPCREFHTKWLMLLP